MAILLDGRMLAASLRHELRSKIAALDFTPTLGVVLVGDDPASHLYVNLKEKAAAEVGIAVEKALFTADSETKTVLDKLADFNTRPSINGILVQLPLPAVMDEHKVIEKMTPTKDADGFHPENLQRLATGTPFVIPGVSQGIVRLIELAEQELAGKKAVLLVNSEEFGRPLVKLLRDRGVEPLVLHQADAQNLKAADIIVVAVGRPGTIRSQHLKDGAIVIDVGTTKVGDRVVGDVAAEELTGRPIYLTPVPGGVGPMTVAMLLWNVYHLAVQQRHSPA